MADHIEFRILSEWNGCDIRHNNPVNLTLKKDVNGLMICINSTFYNDPPPPTIKLNNGEDRGPYDNLWNYEVVEAFFLNENQQYLEVEFNPYGYHLVLMLNGKRNCIKDKLNLQYEANISDDKKFWEGNSIIPWSYFPPNVSKFNAFSIRGPANSTRIYEALFPVDGKLYTEPDFHRLEAFQEIKEFSDIFDSVNNNADYTLKY